ncbi:restriction endonuclease [Leptospira sp. 201903070]|uniref:Restriction endonuclease n=1 Tax=Leptospira ainlahdjerensis TaxID=2810033 RepID=A0ABS2U772_9LEPT|nr:restriction endonuclease [Leptospira ainlahdjerensis]MBM9576213.1 restriction endonuclease [Leptospira ainlahdjerensis]
MNKGTEYEQFVAKIYNAILQSEDIVKSKLIEIELNKRILDNSGILREFDIYWEYELGGLIYKTIIECKDYNSKIPIEKIDALVGKIRDFPDIKAVFATKEGYQSGAETKAAKNNIELLIIREQNDSDWRDENGEPYIRSLMIELTTLMPVSILDFKPVIDLKWLKENTEYDEKTIPSIEGLNNQIFIIDNERNETYSLFDLQSRLSKNESGEFSETLEFADAYLKTPIYKFKMESYYIKYQSHKPVVNPIEIDFSKELYGVVEYLSRNDKKRIFKNQIKNL